MKNTTPLSFMPFFIFFAVCFFNVGISSTNLFAQGKPKTTNNCKTITWTWTLEGYQSELTSKGKCLNKKLAKIDASLTKEGYQKDSDSNSKKITNLLAKKENLALQKRIINKQGASLGSEVLSVSAVFCKKELEIENTKFSYWGIKDIVLPKERKTSKEADLNISSSFKLEGKPFEEKAIVSFEIQRTALNKGTTKIESKTITLDWIVSIKTNKENSKEVELTLVPNSEATTLDAINTSEGTVELYYEGDMKTANATFLKLMNKQLLGK